MKKFLILTTLIAFVCYANFSFSQTILINEGFEGATLPVGWSVFDNDGDGNFWSIFNQPSDAHNGNQFAGVQWNTTGNEDWLITNYISIPANQTVDFTFWAKSLDSSYPEDFYVEVSTDGSTWNYIGSETGIAGTYTNFSYDLSLYSGNSIFIAIICVSVNEYYLCVDDMLLTATPIGVAPVADFSATPTTINEGETVYFTDLSTGTPTSWLWDFGDTQTSTIQNPSHAYSTAGTYDVTLTSTNSFGSDFISKSAYITVNSVPFSSTITNSIGDYFVSGVSPVNNTITASTPSANWIDFYIADSTFTIKYDSLIDYIGGNNTKSWTYDMGLLDTGMIVWAIFYNSSGSYIGYDYYLPNMIVTPEWLLNGYGSLSNVNVVGNSVQMLGHFSFSTQNNPMPTDIPGLNGRPFNLVNPEIIADIDFDCATGLSNIINPNTSFNFNIFDQYNYLYNYPLPSINQLSLDANFNPQIIVEGIYSPTTFKINWPTITYPIVPPIVLKIDGGLTIGAELKGKLQYGYNSTYGAWGIDTARVIAKINGVATLRAKADALIASASGTLIAKGSIGGGFVYSDFTSPNINTLFGGNLEIAGAIDYKLGPSFFTVTEGHLEKTFYQNSWGDNLKSSPFDKQIWDNVDAKGNYIRLLQSNPYLTTPDLFAQPNMSANDSALYVVWLDTSLSNTEILFSKLNYQTQTFSNPLQVTSGAIISNPKVAMLPSGNALICWTQNRYSESTFDTTTMDLTNILQAQDIWVTLYDKVSNSIVPPIMISDDTYSFESGRAEGNANIIMGKGQYGLMTWVVNNDATYENADIWYCSVAEIGNTVYLSAPAQLIDLTGTNKSVNIAYYDSTHAIATWINDPDGLDSTLNNDVVYMEWSQTSQTTGSWGSAYYLISNNGSMSFDEVSLNFNGIYGAVALTATNYDLNGEFQKEIYAWAWNPIVNDWVQPAYGVDSMYYYAQPKVSVNKNGFIVLTYQKVKLFNDTLNPDVGHLYLYMNDSYNDPTTWVPNNGNAYLGDSAVYDWDLSTTYGDLNNFYIITQESDTITGNAPLNPPNGDRFGNLYLNLVIRAIDISGFVITDIPEPITQQTLTKGKLFDFNLYPNPVSTYTTIEYSINTSSKVNIEIFNLFGHKVATLYNGKLNAGTYKAIFEPTGLANGIYLCKVTVDNQSAIKKMIITK